jgi:hypothetical protein
MCGSDAIGDVPDAELVLDGGFCMRMPGIMRSSRKPWRLDREGTGFITHINEYFPNQQRSASPHHAVPRTLWSLLHRPLDHEPDSRNA